ncbi:hypothetical protein [Leptospira stimsonii]|uniref:Uncharacterized protein n=1 Tax=Leptospira stimsonii TaxID=2202203 RepID=A0A4R9KZH6_9LEPT|nr:hypothetical protein [Leptospira stimsonii]RHX88180.1 hypothetical protein DLM78_04290 [Leptospira stimsonii]RHX92579.1 hypothetical protein DLM75_05215 [Leptospira stimsonii]TGK23880.1 hypothetical protein EHO98_04260 [Leptospira stimsonii]TGM10412.1 hypothetical protein EHQ90_18260 [Leptospira stimsonii]
MKYIKPLLYPLYALGLTGYLTYTNMFGGGSSNVDEIENVPKTVRENPGVYRAHYTNFMRYSGGK